MAAPRFWPTWGSGKIAFPPRRWAIPIPAAGHLQARAELEGFGIDRQLHEGINRRPEGQAGIREILYN